MKYNNLVDRLMYINPITMVERWKIIIEQDPFIKPNIS